MNKSGVSLEKEQEGFCLTITNDSYDSCFCQAQIFSDDEKKKIFTVDLRKHPTSISPSVFATDASPSQESDDNSPSQNLTNTSTSPGPADASSSSDMVIIAGVPIGVFILVTIGPCIYKKVKSSRKNTNRLNCSNQQYFEMEGRGEKTAIRDDRVRFENEVLGENGATIESGDLGESETLRADEETLEFGQNGRQERRKHLNRWQTQAKIKKKVTPRGTSNLS